MIYELTLQATQVKTTRFSPPAKLINCKELLCAIGIAYKQAFLPWPEFQSGTRIDECIKKCLEETDNPNVSENVREAISVYILKPDEVVNEDTIIAGKLGYEAGG